MDELECELRIMKFRRLCQDTNYLWRKQAESNRPEGYEVYVPDYDDGVAMGLQIALNFLNNEFDDVGKMIN